MRVDNPHVNCHTLAVRAKCARFSISSMYTPADLARQRAVWDRAVPLYVAEAYEVIRKWKRKQNPRPVNGAWLWFVGEAHGKGRG